MITLYDCATAPSPRRARIFLAEKGVPHETVQIDLRGGEQMGDAYRKINPQCTVPALRTEEDTLLTDNAAIAAYLEARYPEPPLLGRTPQGKAEVASWQWRIEFEGLMAVAEGFRNSSPAMVNRALPGPVDYPQIPELGRRHHCGSGCGFCTGPAAQASGGSETFAAVARGNGGATVDGRLNDLLLGP